MARPVRLSHSCPVVVTALILLAGCASYPAAGFKPGARAQAVPDTPFYPQTRYHCGPAALLSVLEFSGARTTLKCFHKFILKGLPYVTAAMEYPT
jgi:hypothetical protein